MPIHGYPGNVITANPTAPTSSVASGVWTTEQQLAAVAAGNWPFTIPTQQISRSLRFNSADSAYLNRTPASAGNRRTWTWSCWYKATSATFLTLFSGFNGSSAPNNGAAYSRFNNYGAGPGYDKLDFGQYNTGADFEVYTVASFRDYSAWYHIVVALDTTQATNTNRVKIYVNNALQTLSGTYPTQNQDCWINAATAQAIGRFEAGIGQYLNGYMTEVYFIDGQALTPSSFGQTNTFTGVWEPKAYTGTYGTNGFYLNFSDNSGTTSTTLGKDYSGNGNNWTPNNFSVTAGVNNDSMVDSPTSYGTDTGAGGEVRGNYATLNPLTKNNSDTYTITNGNLDFDLGGPTSSSGDLLGTIGVSSGKWYWEVFCTEVTAAGNLLGITNNPTNGTDGFRALGAYTFQYYDDGTPDTNKVQGTGGGSTSTNYGPNTNLLNKTIGFALDLDGATITVYIDGVSQGTMFSSLPSGTYFPLFCLQTAKIQVNFGQRAFAYTAPSGHKALCTQNLPTPTIGATSTTQAGKYFNPILWTATDAASRALTGVGFQPDFLWAKTRNTAGVSHRLYDAVRGATNGSLVTDSSAAQDTTAGQLTSFDTDGFTTGTNKDYLNYGSRTYVGWCWKANGAGSSNTAGTITSTVSANTTSGFSIVTYTGTGANATVGHGIGTAPQMIIIKNRQAANSWVVYHVSIGNGNVLLLNSTNASTADSTAWNTTTPTSTVFSLGSGAAADTNQTSGGGQHVAYCFAPVAGYSAFGSYTGNGSTDGPFVYTGFRPRYIVIKMSSGVEDWRVFDTARSTYNIQGATLYPNTSSAENSSQLLDINSNGFKCRTSDIAVNGSGSTYIYFSFAENPFKYALAR